MILKIKYLSFLYLFTSFTFFYAQQGKVSILQDKKIEKLLEYRKDITVELYKIQIFQGEREDAERVKDEFLNTNTQWPVVIAYNTPNYKIWVGKFRSRLEADRALLSIKKDYINAFIFQSKVENN